jgi:threonine dehydrogenase-like Zn-dependent dehydrogenase
MRTLLLLGAAAIGLAAIGVIKFQTNGDHVDISIDKNRLEHAAEEMVDESKQLANEAEDVLQHDTAAAGQQGREAANPRPWQQ